MARRYYVIPASNPWFYPCRKCAVANRAGPAIWRYMVENNWTEEETAELERWASLMED
jgi:hypothetical protein